LLPNLYPKKLSLLYCQHLLPYRRTDLTASASL